MLISRWSLRVWFFCLAVVVLASCRSTKYVGDGEYLLNRVEIKNSIRSIPKQELNSYIRQRENMKILGFWRFHLGLYNLSGQDSTKGFNKWLRRIGEAPVIYESYLKDISSDQLKIFLQNKGYFRAEVQDSVVLLSPRKVKVVYDLVPSQRFKINRVDYLIEDDSLKAIVESDSIRSLLKRDKPFDSDLHDKERERITEKLKNLGYYSFSKEYVHFVADSTIGNYMVNDSLILKKSISKDSAGLVYETLHKKYQYKNVFYIIESGSEEDLSLISYDTLEYSGSKFLFKQKLEVHPSVIFNSSHIVPGEMYRIESVNKTQLLLANLQAFRYVDIRFREVGDTTQNVRDLNVYIQLASAKPQSFTIEVEGTNSSGNLGAAGNIRYQHRNLFKGAEVLDLSFRTSAEREFVRDTLDKFNTLEVGFDAGIEFPKFLIPYFIEGFRKRYNPKTTMRVAYNYQRRPDYTRTIANFRFGYNWRPTRLVTHYLYVSDMNLIQLPYIHPTFADRIDSTFLKYSYEDHFILNSSYSLVFNNQFRPTQKEYLFGRFNFELAGNLLNLLAPMWQDYNREEGYQIFGIRYAQYVKGDIDLRYHHTTNSINSFAYRFYTGVGYPYGNLKVLPFEKRYFSGGANGIRAWPVRGLGPGTFVDTVSTFYNQTADIKLELNAEYRFKLFWILEGALFVDAGNIWSIRKEGSVEGGLFKWDSFYNEIAVGVGSGIRLDFSYFLLRVDAGIRARDPAKPNGQRWVLGNRDAYMWNNMALNFAIGYPF